MTPSGELCRPEVLTVEAAALVEHGQVVLHRDVVGNRVSRAQAVAVARRTARLQYLTRPSAHLLFRTPTQQIHIDATQDGGPVAPAPAGLLHREDLVFERMLGIDPGLLYQVTRVINERGLDISVAMVTTEAYRVVDVFYVTDIEGQKLEKTQDIEELARKMEQALGETIELVVSDGEPEPDE